MKRAILQTLFALVMSAGVFPAAFADEAYPPVNATWKCALAEAFVRHLRPGMSEVEVGEVLAGMTKDIGDSRISWISMMAGWVPLKLIFKDQATQGFIIVPPQTRLADARNYGVLLNATIRFDETPESTQEAMSAAARDFFEGRRKGRLLEFAAICETRLDPDGNKLFYFGPPDPADRRLPSLAPEKLTNAVYRLLDGTRVKALECRDEPVSRAISSLAKQIRLNRAKSDDLPPDRSGISFSISHGNGAEPSISGAWKNASATKVLDEICEQAGLYWWMTPGCVSVGSKSQHDTAQSSAAAKP